LAATADKRKTAWKITANIPTFQTTLDAFYFQHKTEGDVEANSKRTGLHSDLYLDYFHGIIPTSRVLNPNMECNEILDYPSPWSTAVPDTPRPARVQLVTSYTDYSYKQSKTTQLPQITEARENENDESALRNNPTTRVLAWNEQNSPPLQIDEDQSIQTITQQ
jgi:hypothetical protein